MDRYIVIGNPVSHSLSPEIHARFAQATGEALEYGKLLVPLDEFARSAREFFDSGGQGANVTMPFKGDALRFAHSAADRAKLAGAANVLVRRGDRIEADNTDGAGLVADLTRNLGLELHGKRVLLLGAGGAARGVIAPLLALEPAALWIANRTPERARELAARFSAQGAIEAVDIESIPQSPFDLVLNATSSSVRGEALAIPDHVLHPRAFAYDMAYGDAAKPFIARATARGARACDGLGMLVEQAAESFALWRGRRPQTDAVLSQLRSRFE
jgi:shikimate dehydrogenase